MDVKLHTFQHFVEVQHKDVVRGAGAKGLKPTFKDQQNAVFTCCFQMKNLTIRRLPCVRRHEFYSVT